MIVDMDPPTSCVFKLLAAARDLALIIRQPKALKPHSVRFHIDIEQDSLIGSNRAVILKR